jgi:hypothetical protein
MDARAYSKRELPRAIAILHGTGVMEALETLGCIKTTISQRA